MRQLQASNFIKKETLTQVFSCEFCKIFKNNFYNTYDGCFWLKALKFIKKETLAQVFSCEFCEISKSTFFTEHLLAPASLSRVK